jgi:hypothetical protein
MMQQKPKRKFDALMFGEIVFFGLTILLYMLYPVRKASDPVIQVVYLFTLCGLAFSVTKMKMGSKISVGIFLSLMFMFVMLMIARYPNLP